MNNKQFFELIKSLYAALKCPGCGEVYDIEEIQFLGHMNGLFLMQMTCKKCKLPISLNFCFKNEKEPLVDLSPAEIKALEEGWKRIDANEVIDFHSQLKSFRGDLAKTLRKN